MFANILLAVDLVHGDSQARPAAVAADLARRDGARLHVMTVVPDYGMSIVGSFFPAGFEEAALEKAHQHLIAFARDTIPAGLVTNHVVRHGNIYREIIAGAEEEGCDLIVMGAHRPEMRDHFIGPNAARVVRHATQSVMVVRD